MKSQLERRDFLEIKALRAKLSEERNSIHSKKSTAMEFQTPSKTQPEARLPTSSQKRTEIFPRHLTLYFKI